MGKQGTITSFFRPASSSSANKKQDSGKASGKTPPKPGPSISKKRPRSQTTASNPPKKGEGKATKRLKKLASAAKKDVSVPTTHADRGDGEKPVEIDQPRSSPNKAGLKKDGEGQEGNTEADKDGDYKPNVDEDENDEDENVGDNIDSDELDVTEEDKVKHEDEENDAIKKNDGEKDGDESVSSEDEASESEPSPPKSRARSKAKSSDVPRLSTKRTWKDGAPVPYKFVAEAFAKVEEITGRLEIQAILTQLFRHIIVSTPDDLVPTIYLCINKLAPAHHGIELGIGESILMRALSQVTGLSMSSLKETYKKVGDLGNVASSARTNQKTMFPPPPLTVRKVFSELKAIAQISGKNTQDQKRAKIIKMMVASSKVEAKFIARAVLGKLRIHLADKTVIAALAAAFTLEKLGANTDVLLTVDGKKKSKMTEKEEAIEESIKDATNTLNAVYSQLPVWDVIVAKLLELDAVDDRLLKACKLMPGVPVSPMLAKPTKAIAEVLERFEKCEFTCEYKYDGERAQVHRLADGTIKIYSRNAENLTLKYPDLVRDLPKSLKPEFKKASFIIDAESVAYDLEKKQILPFQELQGRKRKDVNADDVKVKVCIFAFDLLFFNGESLIGESLKDRRERLNSGFVEREGQFMFAKGRDSRDPEQIMEFLNDSIKSGCEGLMVKAIHGANATYEPANRSQNWLKVKKDYLDGCGDSLDLVPIGGYIGRGKRAGAFGAFLLACYDADSEEYQSICKIGTGFTDANLEEFAEFYKAGNEERVRKTPKSYYRTPATDKLAPDVWFEPVQVWEVKCADLSISPQHMAAVGHVDSNKGIALRFPRFIRKREDKKPEEATSAEQVAEFYLRQSSIANNA